MTKKYHLYVVRPEDIASAEKYYLITSKWSLLYTSHKPPEKSREVTDLSMLPSLAVDWLNATINQIREEYLRNNEEEVLRRGKAFNDAFAAELAIEKKKLIDAESGDSNA